MKSKRGELKRQEIWRNVIISNNIKTTDMLHFVSISRKKSSLISSSYDLTKKKVFALNFVVTKIPLIWRNIFDCLILNNIDLTNFLFSEQTFFTNHNQWIKKAKLTILTALFISGSSSGWKLAVVPLDKSVKNCCSLTKNTNTRDLDFSFIVVSVFYPRFSAQ